MLSFSSVDELVTYLRAESDKGERFATRFILLEGTEAWDRLTARLQYEVDSTVHLSEFCNEDDVFPDMSRLISYLKEQACRCKKLLITPLSEWVRLNPERTDVIIQILAEWPVSYFPDGVRRIYVPLLSIKDSFYQAIERVVRYRSGELPQEWYLESEGTADIVVASFLGDAGNRKVAYGIKEYLSLWEKGSAKRVWLKTEFAPWLPVRQIRSQCRVQLYPTCFEYVLKALGCTELKREWGSAEQWEWLATRLREGESLNKLASRLLNVADYNADQLFALWPEFDEYRRWLAWLWSKSRNKPDSYLYHVLEGNHRFNDFPRDAVTTIFRLQINRSYSRERKELLQRIGVKAMPIEFWEAYRKLTDPLARIAVLTDISEEERREIVLCISQLIEKSDSSTDWREYLEIAFPVLAWYLRPLMIDDEFVAQYFSVYNQCRVRDRVNEQLTLLIDRWANQQLLWNYPPRSELLAELRANGAKTYWVDAMGVEWAGLLTQILTEKSEVECEIRVARSSLPTITDANQGWESGEIVERGLDDIAHHYAYVFPDSFLKAMEIIEHMAERVLGLLHQVDTVVITSDHGLSRFSAISEIKVDVPEGAEVVLPGRYAILKDCGPQDVGNYQCYGMWVSDNDKLFLLTHARAKGSSYCPGEVHGGATPEEFLVPVIIVRKARTELQFELVDNVVRLNPKGEGVLTMRCNRVVHDLRLLLRGQIISGKSENGREWVFLLRMLKSSQHEHTAEVYCGTKPVGRINFRTVKGITQSDLGI
ncbi:MAG TPA: BREX-4 system phosphatase PglZ [Firmicutes bacterium]|nr:BREX-4 system phosphatase PglZ [Candidatus Fermentithermobacillaceae bacterium]